MKIKDFLTDQYLVLTENNTTELSFSGLYATDLLSQAIHSAKPGNIFVTIISNLNSLAIAVMLDLPCLIISAQKEVSQKLIDKANEEGIAVISTKLHSHQIIIDLHDRGFI